MTTQQFRLLLTLVDTLRSLWNKDSIPSQHELRPGRIVEALRRCGLSDGDIAQLHDTLVDKGKWHQTAQAFRRLFDRFCISGAGVGGRGTLTDEELSDLLRDVLVPYLTINDAPRPEFLAELVRQVMDGEITEEQLTSPIAA